MTSTESNRVLVLMLDQDTTNEVLARIAFVVIVLTSFLDIDHYRPQMLTRRWIYTSSGFNLILAENLE